MNSIERSSVQDLQPNERAEVDAALRGPAMHRVAGVLLIVWTIQHWARTAGNRGTLRTSFATFIVRGSRLQGMRHANVAAIKCRTIGKRGGRFTVFELVANDRTELTTYVNPPWAQATIATIQQLHGGRIPVSER
jgi:hypothetical protein